MKISERQKIKIPKSFGISEEQIHYYLNHFEKNDWYLTLDRPCTTDDGIMQIDSTDEESLINEYEKEALKGRALKFVPASGAATRMFQCLWHLIENQNIHTYNDLMKYADKNNEDIQDVLRFFVHLNTFAFFEAIVEWCSHRGKTIEDYLTKGPLKELVEGILNDIGLGHLPKALIPFHRYPHGPRTAFEEHIVEACGYVTDGEGICRIHFTVDQAHLDAFLMAREKILKNPAIVDKGCIPRIDFSIQSPSTHTPAVHPDNRLFLDEDGHLLLRPGGHGALLKNLQECKGDIVFIKNIDNVVSDDVKPLIIRWKKILGGILVRLERDVNNALRLLYEKGENAKSEVEYVCRTWGIDFCYTDNSNASFVKGLKATLDRPKRVCGMVKNIGAPGGGPFWVKNRRGCMSKQIVEKAQVRLSDKAQKSIWESSTHFNPVDIVCSLIDSTCHHYDLAQFTDPDAVIIAHKHYKGKPIKVIEHPGLWNGGMAKWITVFVEVPSETFRPVKKITDLLES